MRLQSGPANYDRLYNAFVLALCFGLGGYFFYDWKIGYPQRNYSEAKKQLSALMNAGEIPAQLPPKPTDSDFEAFRKLRNSDAAALRSAFGQPLTSKPGPAGSSIEYYVSATGMATATVTSGKLSLDDLQWTKWYKSQSEVNQQWWCGLVAAVVGAYFLPRTLRSFLLTASIDDQGLTYAGQKIAFDAMKRLTDYNPKGWVDLYYAEGGQEKKLRFDNQKIAKFDEIIDEICKAKGFPDPRSQESGA